MPVTGKKIYSNVSLKDFNTFGVEVFAKFYTEVTSTQMVVELCKQAMFVDQEVLLLGGGSNILLTQDFSGLVVRNCILGREIVAETTESIDIKIGAGEIWQEIVEYAIDEGFGGLENLSLIPGTVGAAPVQNIGAYGVEIKDIFVKLEAVNRKTGKVHIFDNEAFQFGYRSSIFTTSLVDKYVITWVTLKLSKKPILNVSYGQITNLLAKRRLTNPTIRDISEIVIEIRQSKLPDPDKIGNAGSFFKNPIIPLNHYDKLKIEWPNLPGSNTKDGESIKVPAAWLIEKCGFKGKRYGNVGVYSKHALVLVNYGGGTGMEIQNLANNIQKTVEKTFGIKLEPEVNIV